MQECLDELQNWSTTNHMKLNPSKCFGMNVTFMKTPPIHNDLCIGESVLAFVTSAKILGVTIQSNLKWDVHVGEILKKCNKKLYMFRLLKQYGMPVEDLETVFVGYIRPLLEYCTPVFNGALTKKQITDLEKVQKRVCKIILGRNYSSYQDACQIINLETLDSRRKSLSQKFAKSLTTHPNCRTWLPPPKRLDISLRKIPTYDQFKCKTSRFRNSPLPYLIDLLNES